MRYQAYLHIRQKIVSLELPPGAVIDEAALQQELNMGRTPIREALQRLSLEKLVNILARRGMFVTEIGITDLQRLFELRLNLESLAVELACQRGTPEQFDEMQVVLDRLPADSADANGEDTSLLIEIDETSHRLIYQAASNKFLEDTLSTLYALSLRLWYFALTDVGSLPEAVAEHRSILNAMRIRDAETASHLIKNHIRTFQDEIQNAMLGEAQAAK
jgi:DNA-binding GntR family transcriptional regulator